MRKTKIHIIAALTTVVVGTAIFYSIQHEKPTSNHDVKLAIATATPHSVSPPSFMQQQGAQSLAIPANQIANQDPRYTQSIEEVVVAKSVKAFSMIFAGMYGVSPYAKHEGHFVKSPDKPSKDFVIVSVTDRNKIATKVIYRDYKQNGDYELGTVGSVLENNWVAYPPISREKATRLLLDEHKVNLVAESGLYSTDGMVPWYFFKTGDNYYMVDAESGKVVKGALNDLNEKEKEPDPIFKIVELRDGFLMLKPEAFKTLPEKERLELEASIRKANEAVSRGEIRINEKLEAVPDR
jgi:hypothetical protein